MSKLVVNPTQHILYCRAASGDWLASDRLLTLRPRPNLEDAEAYLSGLSDIPCAAGSYSPIAGLCAIPPKTRWLVSEKRYSFEGDLRSYRASPTTLDSCLHYARRLLTRANYGDLLGVELSGGLDSSIIIEFLMRWKIPFALIGMRTDRYEFRTERAIQSYYAQRCPTVRLYSGKDVPAFSRLDEVPPHPYPTMGSLNFSHAQKRAEICRDLGVTTLLSGDAGDRLFSFPSPQWSMSGRLPENWAYWNLAQTIWSDQYVFHPMGIRFLSGLAMRRIPTLILQLRTGLDEDRMKLWARRTLKAYLPDILSEYAFKAFHDGWMVDSIISARRTIRKMSELVFDIVPHPKLAPNTVDGDVVEFRTLNLRRQHDLLLSLSFITWVYSNHRR